MWACCCRLTVHDNPPVGRGCIAAAPLALVAGLLLPPPPLLVPMFVVMLPVFCHDPILRQSSLLLCTRGAAFLRPEPARVVLCRRCCRHAALAVLQGRARKGQGCAAACSACSLPVAGRHAAALWYLYTHGRGANPATRLSRAWQTQLGRQQRAELAQASLHNL